MPRTLLIATVLGVATLGVLATERADARGEGNPLDQPVVYVTGQDLYYDSAVPVEVLPHEGPFQLLEGGGPHGGPQTQYGPGDPGYVGGRWWMDTNPNGYMDDQDRYFLCPLLGPGREEP